MDVLHMLEIVAPPVQAIELAEISRQESAGGWLGLLYNNMGWSYHDLGHYLRFSA
jgi:hypothetical protein